MDKPAPGLSGSIRACPRYPLPGATSGGFWRPSQAFRTELEDWKRRSGLVAASRGSPRYAPASFLVDSNGCGSKLNHQGTTGFGPCCHLPGFHFGYLVLTHCQIRIPKGGGMPVKRMFACPMHAPACHSLNSYASIIPLVLKYVRFSISNFQTNLMCAEETRKGDGRVSERPGLVNCVCVW